MKEYDIRIKEALLVSFLFICLASCGDKGWESTETVLLDGVSPIGITHWNNEMWLSDGDNNRMVVIDEEGNVVREDGPIQRPMHIISRRDKMYIPSYGSDQIYIYGEEGIDTLSSTLDIEGPGGVDVVNGFTAIADFYNHQVITFDGTEWKAFGGKGKEDGKMHYPTDIQIEADKLWVADAYNNRIQVFDLSGNHLKTFGQDLGMNAATGLFVTEDEVYVTDFENSRLFVFDHEGKVIQLIESGLDKPTDVYIHDNTLWVINYQGKFISKFRR